MLALTVLVALGTLPPALPPVELTHHSEVGRFSVTFPTHGGMRKRAESVSQTGYGPTTNYRVYSSGDNDHFEVTFADYPVAGFIRDDPQAVLDNVCDGNMGPTGKESKRSRIEVGGYPGREVTYSQPDGNLVFRNRVVLVNNRLYQVMVIGVGQLPEQTEEFYRSVTLIPPRR